MVCVGSAKMRGCHPIYAVLVACLVGVASTGGFGRSSNFYYPGPGFRTGGPLGPQQNVDGLWTFIAVPIPLENQTVPEGDFPQEQVAQARLWGPVYRPGHGWVYGEAGFILVPRMPPYVPPTIIAPPPPAGNGGITPASVIGVSGKGVGSAAQPIIKSPAAPVSSVNSSTTEKAETETGNENSTEEKSDSDSKVP
ncbi:hypothetical protein BIW11_08547 [Tropilaelaps mercedesae]|uniref:Uncharacterized protein n=1 Tax=Tropilaelaps mercedesae TaxID=418985 RepID=A0A1V9XPA4_9ACAR|nr:hypothetical protein BIW11_08547 [Tropilaelaps mercedesae]